MLCAHCISDCHKFKETKESYEMSRSIWLRHMAVYSGSLLFGVLRWDHLPELSKWIVPDLHAGSYTDHESILAIASIMKAMMYMYIVCVEVSLMSPRFAP